MMPAEEAYRALRDVAILLGRDAPADEILPTALESVRRAAGLDKLALVWRPSPGEDCAEGERCWVSADRGQTDLQSRIEKAAASVFEMRQPPFCPIEIPFGRTRLQALCLPSQGSPTALLLAGGRDAADGYLELLTAAAGQFSLLLDKEEQAVRAESARQHARKRIAEVSTIYEIGEAMDAFAVDQVLSLIPEKAAAVMGAQACSLMLVEPEGRHLVIVAHYGLEEEIARDVRVAIGEGIAGRVAQTGEPMLIRDVECDPRFAGTEVRQRKEIGSSMCVPLKDAGGELQGVLSIRRHVPAEHFTQDDLKLFCIFANQAAMAISNAQLYSRLNRRIQELSNISELTQAISSTLDLSQVLERVADSITQVVGFDRCCVYLQDPHTQELAATVHRGFEIGRDVPAIVRPCEGPVGLAAHEKIPIFTRDVTEASDDQESKTSLAAPIVVREASIGVVLVDNQLSGRPINPIAVELLATFINQAGIAIENARLYEAMEEKYSELNALYEQSKAISSAYGLENTARLLVDVAMKGAACDGGLLLLFDQKQHTLRVAVSTQLPEGQSNLIEDRLTSEEMAAIARDLRDPIVLPIATDSRLSKKQRQLFDGILPSGCSAILTPLVAEDATVGVLALFRRSGQEFSASDVQLLSITVSHAAAVLKNAAAYEERMRQSVLELSALYEFSRRISSASTLEDALDSILAIVEELVACDESVIYAADHEHGLMIPKAVRIGNERADAGELAPLPMAGDTVLGWAMRERKAIVSPDISLDERFSPSALGDRAIKSLMAIPLLVQDEVVGVLGVRSCQAGRYSEDDVRVLSIIASQGAAIYRELDALAALTSYTDNILSSIAAGVITLDSDGTILTWNKSAEKIIGIKAERAVGQHYMVLVNRLELPQSDKDMLLQTVENVFRDGETFQGYKLCFQPLYRDRIYVNLSMSQLVDSSGEQLGLVCIFEEVTDKIKMEDEFRRMGELAAIGQLAASIAHELRNPLSSIKGAAQFLHEQYSDHSTIEEFLTIIVEEVNGLNRLTTEFLEFARPIEIEPKPICLNEVVEKTLRLMAVHISESRVEVVDELDPDLPIIEADGEQIEQILKNVILNAVEAMPDGGTLRIRTRASAAYGGCVELSVSDTGTGIAPDKLDRIFLPFVTTKTKGTGLGLSVVQKIVENHGGHIEVQSALGEGTTFRVFFKTAEAGSRLRQAATES